MSWSIAGVVVGGAIGAASGGSGAALAGAIFKGVQVGATVGAIIDGLTAKSPQNFVDTWYSSVSYGTPINRVWGAGRVDGQIIWVARNSDGTYLTEQDFSAGGKKGLSGTVQHYFVSMAVNIAETGFTFPDQTQIERKLTIDIIRMADQIVYINPNTNTFSMWSASQVYDIGDIVEGSDTRYWQSRSDGNQNHNPASNANPNWWTQLSTTNTSMSITQHPESSESTFTMAVDSNMSTWDSVSSTQAYRGNTYFYVGSYDLYNLGNTIPNNISIQCHTSSLVDGDFLSDVCRFAGLSSSVDFNFSACTTPLTGFVQNSRTTCQDLLTNFLLIKGYDLAEVDGKITAVARGGASVVTIPDTDLGAVMGSLTVKDRLPAEILADRRELHSAVQVRYMDPAQNFRVCEINAIRGDAQIENPWAFDIAMPLTGTEAAQLAMRLRDTEWLEAGGTFGPITLSGAYGYLAPADCVELNYNSILTRFRITKMDWQPGLISANLVRDEIEINTQYSVGDVAPVPANPSFLPHYYPLIIASPPVDPSASLSSYPGFYFWVGDSDPAEGSSTNVYGNPSIQYSFDDFTTIAGTAPAYPQTCPMGYTSSSPLGATTSYNFYDNTSSTYFTSIVPTDRYGQWIHSIGQGAAEAGLNIALVGNEWIEIAYTTNPVSLTQQIGPGIVRGVNGSSTSGHVINENFTVNPSGIAALQKIQVNAKYVGQTVYVRVIDTFGNTGPVSSCTITSPTQPYVPNSAPVAPSGISVGTPAYSSSAEVLSYTATFSTTPPAGQTLAWQYSTTSGVAWSSSTLTGTNYTPPSFTSGSMQVQCTGITTDGRTSATVQSTITNYSAPPQAWSETPSGSVNGSNVTFGLTHIPITSTLFLYVNGTYQIAGTNYTLSGSTITMAVAPSIGAMLHAAYQS